MKTFLLVDQNEIDLFILEKVALRYSGIKKILKFQSMQKAWEFLTNNDESKIVALIDLKTFLDDSRLFSHPMKLQEDINRKLEVYFLTLVYPYTEQGKPWSEVIKGYIEKPLTYEKLKEILID